MTRFTAFDLSFEADVEWDDELCPEIVDLRCCELGHTFDASFMLESAALSHTLNDALVRALHGEAEQLRNDWLADRAA